MSEKNDVGSQLADYGKQMRDLLSASKAEVRTYKFSVEKTDSGFDLDLALKVSFNSRKANHDEDEESIETVP